jgi:hypothetical protein
VIRMNLTRELAADPDALFQTLLDASARRFEYTSRTDDADPSYTLRSWTVSGTERGSRVSVSWELNPKTFWRRVLLVRVRQHQLLKSEVPTSLAALGGAASWTTAHDG